MVAGSANGGQIYLEMREHVGGLAGKTYREMRETA
jgi:hypothetical protein